MLIKAMFAMDPGHKDAFFGPDELARLAGLAEIDPDLVVAGVFDAPGLGEVEVLITGWGCPQIDEDVLARAPRLSAVIHAAGTVKNIVTDACWERGIAVSSAAAVNAIPVAEYTVATILFAGKRVLGIGELYRRERRSLDWTALFPSIGNYRKVVGVIGASRIGRRVLRLLQSFDLELLVADPYLDGAEATALGARLVPLEELLRTADVVTVHAPELPETRHMLDGGRLAMLRDGSTLINTARGSLVDQAALTAELVSGRIDAVLDVTDPDVPPPDSPLYELPNVLLTPHIAGSLGGELRRLARSALDELERYTQGRPFAHAVRPETLAYSA